MARQATVEEMLESSFKSQMNRVYTSIPCIVVGVDNLKESRIDVRPAIDILKQDGTTSKRQTILNVPVQFPSSSTSAFTFPIFKGDTVLCCFSMRAMEMFNEGDGQPSPPNNFAKFHQKDAVAIPGLFPRKKSINNPSIRTNQHSILDTVVVHNLGTVNEVEVRLKPDGDVVINSPAKVQINCQTAEINAEQSASITTPSLTVDADNTTWNGNVGMNGTLTLDGINMNVHTHTQPEDSRGDTEMPTGGPQ